MIRWTRGNRTNVASQKEKKEEEKKEKEKSSLQSLKVRLASHPPPRCSDLHDLLVVQYEGTVSTSLRCNASRPKQHSTSKLHLRKARWIHLHMGSGLHVLRGTQ